MKMKTKKLLTLVIALTISTSAIVYGSQTQFSYPLFGFVSNLFEQAEPTNIPDHVLYDKLFRMVFVLKNKAESGTESSERIIGLTNYFKNRANLNDDENKILQETAVKYIDELTPIDDQARAIIVQVRQGIANGTIKRSDPPPPELFSLQEQKNQLALQYRNRLQASLGATRFVDFDNFIHNNFASNMQAIPHSSINYDQEQ